MPQNRFSNLRVNKKYKNRHIDCRCCGGRSGWTWPRATKHRSDDGSGFATSSGWDATQRVPLSRPSWDSDEVHFGISACDSCANCGGMKGLMEDPLTHMSYCGECWLEWGYENPPEPSSKHRTGDRVVQPCIRCAGAGCHRCAVRDRYKPGGGCGLVQFVFNGNPYNSANHPATKCANHPANKQAYGKSEGWRKGKVKRRSLLLFKVNDPLKVNGPLRPRL